MSALAIVTTRRAKRPGGHWAPLLSSIAAMLIRRRARDLAGYATIMGLCSERETDDLCACVAALLFRESVEKRATVDGFFADAWLAFNADFSRHEPLFRRMTYHRAFARELRRPWGRDGQ